VLALSSTERGGVSSFWRFSAGDGRREQKGEDFLEHCLAGAEKRAVAAAFQRRAFYDVYRI